jgi:hypothetical protein
MEDHATTFNYVKSIGLSSEARDYRNAVVLGSLLGSAASSLKLPPDVQGDIEVIRSILQSSPYYNAATIELPFLSITSSRVSAPGPGPATASFTVSLSRAYFDEVRVNFSTASGIAATGTDFVPASGTLVFNPGETSKTLSLTVLPNTHRSGNKIFYVALSQARNAYIAASRTAGVGTILG